MEKQNKTVYNKEYQRQKRGNTLENAERLTVILPKENKDKLKEIASKRQIVVN